MAEEIEYECEINFQQVDYIIALNTVQMSTFDPTSLRLIIDVEEKQTGELWRGDFTAKYIEEITNKTGSYKKFSVFVKMMLSALKK